MALPEKYHLDALRKLRGDASVTFPGGSTAVVRVERVQTVARGSALPAFLSADEEYPGAKLVEQQVLGGDANHVEVYRLWHTLPGVEVTRYTIDEETRCPVAVTTQVVQAMTFAELEDQMPGTQVEYQPINSVYGTKITTVINGGTPPALRSEYGMVEYPFPTLLFGITAEAGPQARDGTARLRLVSDRRTGFTALTEANTFFLYGDRDFLNTQFRNVFDSGFPNAYVPRFQNLIYEGIAFDINERNVLNDAFAGIIYNSGTENPKWPYFVETYDVPAVSEPTASAYRDVIGEFAYVSGDLKPWRAGWWRLELLTVKLQ